LPPFVFLGWAEDEGSQSVVHEFNLRTRVPRVSAGIYAFVIYVGARHPGVLVTDTSDSGKLLRVRGERSSDASEGSGTDDAWWIAGAVGLTAIVAVGVVLRRRRSA